MSNDKLNKIPDVKVTFDSMMNYALDSTLSNHVLFIGGHTGQGKSEGGKLVSKMFPNIANSIIKNDGIVSFLDNYKIGQLIKENLVKQFTDTEMGKLKFKVESKYFYISMPQLMKGDDALPITLRKEVILREGYVYTKSPINPNSTLVGLDDNGNRDIVKYSEELSNGKYYISSVYYAPNETLEEIVASSDIKVEGGVATIYVPFILLDEFNRGDRDVLQTFITQVLEKTVYGYKMPKYTQFILTGNNGFEGDEAYDGLDLDPAMKARMTTIILEQSAAEFVSYLARTNAHPAIVQMLRTYPEHITISDSESTSIANPRMWENLSNHIKTVVAFSKSKISKDAHIIGEDDSSNILLKHYISNRNNVELMIDRKLKTLPDTVAFSLRSMIFDKAQTISFEDILNGKFIKMIEDEKVHSKFIMAQRCTHALKTELKLKRSKMSKGYIAFIDKHIVSFINSIKSKEGEVMAVFVMYIKQMDISSVDGKKINKLLTSIGLKYMDMYKFDK